MSPSPVIDERYDNYAQRNEIASNREILLIFLIFLFVLAILYPEKMLRKQVLAEKSNYELTGVYLENMLRLEPDNTNLMLAAADVSLERGNLDLAEKLLDVLQKSDTSSIEKQLKKIQFKLIKTQIAQSSDPDYIAQKRKDLVKTIDKIAEEGLFDKKDALLWYRDALALSQKKAARIFLESISGSSDRNALEECALTRAGEKAESRNIACIEKLSRGKGPAAKKWMIAAWTLYADEGKYEKAAEILQRLVKIDPGYRDILAQMQSAAGRFSESADLYMLLYRSSSSYEHRKAYLIKAISALEDGKRYKEAVALAQHYEDDYLKDEAMTQRLIKRYLSMDNVKAARRLSLKLLERDK